MYPRCLAALCALLLCLPLAAAPLQADRVVVDKSARQLTLYRQGKILLQLPMVLGGVPRGHKQQQGDRRTPEGRYLLDWKNPDSRYFRSIRISYPNAEDRARAASRGVNPGGDIFIHGQPNQSRWPESVLQEVDWTDGCIALRNADMQAVWDRITVPVSIEIRP
ncbi:murein L,D-transpeptidase family protein [Leeia sp.]|uniref:L,D-transpeptidase family protein n=1 Tax=Leeia sp. TaxID=2884678 RepID=UPI0035B09272